MSANANTGFLDGRSAIVTGAARGLGAAFAAALAAEGATVTLCDVNPAVEDAAAALGGNARALVADVSVRADVERTVAAAMEAGGGLDLLVNNAARWTRSPVTDGWDKALADWEFIMDANLKGALMMGRACVPHLVARGGGNIVNVSTYYVLPARSAGTNPPGTDLYAASKWALNGLTQAWALALAEHGVRVNALCMGATDTAMLRGLFEGEPPAETVAAWMRPEQIAGQLLDLLREGPDGRTGENIGAWVGEPVELGPRKPPHEAISGARE